MNISFLTFTTIITLSITNLVQSKELLTEKDIVKTAEAPNIAISQDDQTNIHANIGTFYANYFIIKIITICIYYFNFRHVIIIYNYRNIITYI